MRIAGCSHATSFVANAVASLVLVMPLAGQQKPDGSPAPAQVVRKASSYEQATLGPGDGLRIVIYRQPDVSGEYKVDEFGDLVLPLIDQVSVLGKSIGQLEAELVEKYRAFYRSPIIQVTPLYRINVLGEVRQAGLYPVDPTMTLPDVLALAGGLTPNGSFEKIHMLRSGREVRLDISDPEARSREVGELGLRSGDQIMVGEKGRSLWQAAPAIAGVVAAGATILALVSN